MESIKNDSLLYSFLLFLAIAICLNLAILLAIHKIIRIREKQEKEMIDRREKMIMRFLMAVLLLATASAQDVPPTIDSISMEQPVVFPDAMEKATCLISEVICPSCLSDELAWRSGIMDFLKNNTTWGNMSA